MKTTVIIYDGVSETPTIVVEDSHTRDIAPATVWQPEQHRRELPFMPEHQAQTAEQVHTLFKREIGKTVSRCGLVRFGGRITSDGAADYLDT